MLKNGNVRIVLKEVDNFGNHVTMNFEGVSFVIGNDAPFVGIEKADGTAMFIAQDAILSCAFTPVKTEV